MEATNGTTARKRLAELGRLLAAAEGYHVLTSTGHKLGRVEHVRYQQYADRPDEIVVRSRTLLRTRRYVYVLSAVLAVNPRDRTVVIGPAGVDDPPPEKPRPAPTTPEDEQGGVGSKARSRRRDP